MNLLKANITLTSLTLAFFSIGSVFAAEKAAEKATEKTAEKTEEVDISDIQNQYWKAHDKEFEVIQNKQYTKANKLELAPLFGLYQRVSFQDTKTLGLAITYHFSEIWGAEVMGYKMFNEDSGVLKRFKETRNATIEHNEEHSYLGAAVVFTPIYAKFSFLGKKISHFDLYVSPTLGVTQTVDWRFTYGLGIGQKFWLNPKWNVRVEYRWTQYTDRIATNEGITAVRNGGPGYYEDTVNNQNLLFGISYLL